MWFSSEMAPKTFHEQWLLGEYSQFISMHLLLSLKSPYILKDAWNTELSSSGQLELWHIWHITWIQHLLVSITGTHKFSQGFKWALNGMLNNHLLNGFQLSTLELEFAVFMSGLWYWLSYSSSSFLDFVDYLHFGLLFFRGFLWLLLVWVEVRSF